MNYTYVDIYSHMYVDISQNRTVSRGIFQHKIKFRQKCTPPSLPPPPHTHTYINSPKRDRYSRTSPRPFFTLHVTQHCQCVKFACQHRAAVTDECLRLHAAFLQNTLNRSRPAVRRSELALRGWRPASGVPSIRAFRACRVPLTLECSCSLRIGKA